MTVFLIGMTFFPLSLTALAGETLNLLVWEGYAPADQVAKFENHIKDKYKTSVTLNVDFISDPNDFFTAVRGKSADIISPTHNLFKDNRFNFINKKLFLPVDLANVPNYKNIIPALQMADYATENHNVYGIPFVHGPYGLAYNTKHLNAPLSWNVFWDPKYSNRYSISSDYYECNIYITALALGLRGPQLHNAGSHSSPEFRNKLKALVKNAASLWKGVDKADDLEGLSLGAVWGFSLPELKKRGANWAIADPLEGTMGWVDNYAICWSLKDKPFLKKIAEEWLNFTLSPDFQVQVVVRGLGSDPVNLTIKERLTKEEVEKTHMDEPDYFQYNRILWPTLNSIRERNHMKKIWNDALKSR